MLQFCLFFLLASVVVVVGSGISIFKALPNSGLNTHKNWAVRRDVLWVKNKRKENVEKSF